MSITVKDVADMVERVDEKLSPLTRYDGFQPYEGIYRLGDWGYVTETEYNKAFEHEDGWAQDAYILDGNGVSHTRISQLINEDDTGKAISGVVTFCWTSLSVWSLVSVPDGFRRRARAGCVCP